MGGETAKIELQNVILVSLFSILLGTNILEAYAMVNREKIMVCYLNSFLRWVDFAGITANRRCSDLTVPD